MHVLAEFIEDQMRARGWQAVHLVNASGLAKQTVSKLLHDDRQPQRMLEPATLDGLARAFCWTEADDPTPEEYEAAFEHWKGIILLKTAEAIGVPVMAPVTIPIPAAPSDEYVLAIVREALQLRRRLIEGDGQRDPSEAAAAPNTGGADEEAGNKVSGGTATSGDVRDPQRQSRGSDETNDLEQPSEHSNPPQL